MKKVCSGMLDAPLTDYDVLFTSNTTEVINLLSESLSRETGDCTEPIIMNTVLEHSSNDLPWRMIPGFSLIRLPVNDEGFINLEDLEIILNSYNKLQQHGKKRIRLLALSGASNVLGTCNNVSEISRIVHGYGVRLLVDAAQLIAHHKVGIKQCGIDFLAFSAHKVYAPFGCGVLVVKKGLLNFNSDEMELIRSSGEENAGGIAALGKALLLIQRIGMDIIREEEQALTRRAVVGMSQINGMEIYGIKRPESQAFTNRIGVIAFSLKNKMANNAAKELAELGGIGVRFGCHCAHILLKHLLKVPPSLERFQKLILTLFPALRLPGVVRISIGIENTEEDIDTLIYVLGKITAKTRYPRARQHASSENAGTTLSLKEVKKRIDILTNTSAQNIYA